MKAYPDEVRQRARELDGTGVRADLIASILGIPYTTIRRWVNPEYAEQMRLSALRAKQGYRGTCIDCGRSTSYSGHRTLSSKRCLPCRKAFDRANIIWPHEAIVDAVQRWAAIHGRPPRSKDWLHSDPVNHYPSQRSTYGPRAPFATWNDAIRAAGLEPTPSGYYSPEEFAGVADERRRAGLGRHLVPNEAYIEQIRAASRDGIAPASQTVHNAWWQLRRRGIHWEQACALAGVRPRGRGDRRYARGVAPPLV